jgi:hypothetical protein
MVAHSSAHTWIEQAQVIGVNGSYVGDYGYARGFVDRANPHFDGYANKWQVPDPRFDIGLTRVSESMLLCHPSQRNANYTSANPMLRVVPGDFVAMKYLENGHVTRPWDPEGKPPRSGTVWVYATYKPKENEKLWDVLQWNASGTAGNGDGWLMATQNFDDGRCYQINTSRESLSRQSKFPNHSAGRPDIETEQWCETDILIHDKVQVNSTITIYWVWGWETAPGTKDIACGKDEYYTSCLDLDVVDGRSRSSQDPAVRNTQPLSQQDPQSKAVLTYRSRGAIRKRPILVTEGSCGSQPYPGDVFTPTGSRAIAGIESSHSLTLTQQSSMRATDKSIFKLTGEKNVTAAIVDTMTATATNTTTSTITSTTTVIPIVTVYF